MLNMLPPAAGAAGDWNAAAPPNGEVAAGWALAAPNGDGAPNADVAWGCAALGLPNWNIPPAPPGAALGGEAAA